MFYENKNNVKYAQKLAKSFSKQKSVKKLNLQLKSEPDFAKLLPKEYSSNKKIKMNCDV